MFKLSDRRVPVLAVFLLLLAVNLFYQYYIRQHLLLTGFCIAAIEALVCAIIIFAITRLDLVKVSLCFLAFPYLFFIPGWLNTPTALTLAVIFIYGLAKTLRATTAIKYDSAVSIVTGIRYRFGIIDQLHGDQALRPYPACGQYHHLFQCLSKHWSGQYSF